MKSRRPPTSLRQRVQHVNGFRELRDVENAVFDLAVDPDLAYASSYVRHRAPVGWDLSALHAAELITGLVPCLAWERPHLLARASDPE